MQTAEQLETEQKRKNDSMRAAGVETVDPREGQSEEEYQRDFAKTADTHRAGSMTQGEARGMIDKSMKSMGVQTGQVARTRRGREEQAAQRTGGPTGSPLQDRPYGRGTERPQEKGGGPVFGEEGFGDVENRRTGGGGGAPEAGGEAGGGGPEAARQSAFNQRTSDLRRQGAQARTNAEGGGGDEEEESDEDSSGGLSDVEQAKRDGVDALMAKACIELPVLGHLLWWNVKMIWGSWVTKGRSKLISPFTVVDVLLILAPKAPPGAKEGGAKIVPDVVMQFLLVMLDLVVAICLLVTLTILMLPFILAYVALTDPGLIAEFVGTNLSSLSSLF